MKNILTNKAVEKVLIAIILLFRSKQWIFKFVPTNKDFKSGSFRSVNRNNITYKLDISDYQQWLIYFYCKSDSSDHLLTYLENSRFIFDIGANIGQTSLNILRTQRNKGIEPQIYAFEPFPDTFDTLTTNVNLNNATNEINCINKGLGAQTGLLPMLKHNAGNSGGFRITKQNTVDTIQVEITTLDTFVFENKIPKVDFIKIDVEGFEIEVLNGAKNTLQTFRPILIFEYSTENIHAQGGDIEKLFDELMKLNYKIKTKEGISNIEDIYIINYQTDVICIPV
jgi:FkbM family methyltransferase